MDQIQDQLDPEVAREVIKVLNRKVANLRSENAELQDRLSKSSVKPEDEVHDAPNNQNSQRLLEEIENYKSELERRPAPGEVAALEEKLGKSEQRGQELEQQANLLNAKLEESESGKRTATAVQEALEKEIGKLCHILNERTREKEKLIAQLKSSSNAFDFRKFLDGKVVDLPPRHPPARMTAEEARQFKDMVLERGEEFFSTTFPQGILWAGESGGCVVPLPSVLYNGKTQIAEVYRFQPVVNYSYQLCGVDGLNHYRTYHGTYRCIAVVRADWGHLKSINQEVAELFLGRVVIEKGPTQGAVISLIQQLYQTGAMKVDYAVLQYERFDGATVKRVQSTEGHSTAANAPFPHAGGKRSSDQYQEWAGSSVKKPRLKN